jgi:iron complex outermembrane recepter protein
MKTTLLLLCLPFLALVSYAQENPPAEDTTAYRSLEEVEVRGFDLNRSAMNSGSAVKVIEPSYSLFGAKSSLVTGFNTVAGVRLEERSPGSYRLNIRGSSIRSPFGVRNVKVYWNGLPITDPGGNTYFNQFAQNNFSGIEIFKGPAGSMYGAGTGGLVWMETTGGFWKRGASIEYMTGSYGLQNIFATIKTGNKNNGSVISYAHNQHDGYREQSAMRRDNFSWSSQMTISNRQQLLASVLFTDLYYQTPGGLTQAEFNNDPKAARPAAGGFPGAEQAKATIYQKNLLAGIQHRYQIDTHWSNTTSLYAAFAHIKNPTVRNYERRNEPHAGGRTSFTWHDKNDARELKFIAGAEMQQGFFNTRVFGNRQGNPDTLQTDDDMRFNTWFAFVQGDVSIGDDWFFTLGTSLNRTRVEFTRLSNRPVLEQSRTYRQEWAPRISVLKKFGPDIAVFANMARGFSPPTTAELLPSTGVISTNLEAESGTNYEAGVRFNVLNSKLRLELIGYHFRMNNTLVQRRDLSGADFFINAGNTRQKGLEATASYLKVFYGSMLDYITTNAAYAYSSYTYGSLRRDTVDFSGKRLPSVPAHTFSLVADIHLKNKLYSSITYYHASRIFLNDANTASAEGYHLLGVQVGWSKDFSKRFTARIYAGADNLLDEVYSLGNDINDPRGRFFNTAPRRNYYVGLLLNLFGK